MVIILLIFLIVNSWQHHWSISYSLLIACLSSISPPKPWLKYYFHWKNCSDFYLVHLYRVSFFSLPTSNHNNWHLARISINQMLGKTYLLDMVLLLCEKWEKLGQMKTKTAVEESGSFGERKAGLGLIPWHCFLSKENSFNQLQKYLWSICSSLLVPICPYSLLSWWMMTLWFREARIIPRWL